MMGNGTISLEQIETLYAQLTRMQKESNLALEKHRYLVRLYIESETTIVAQIHEIQGLQLKLEASHAPKL